MTLRGYGVGMVTNESPTARSAAIGSLDISYDDRVLEPRAWTEWQASWAAELAAGAPAGPILELCTGAGHIGLLTVAQCDRDLVAVDVSEDACRFATQNALAAGLGGRVEVRQALVQDACRDGEVFPIILADPPWVPSEQTARFPADPLSAIDGGADGLEVARACTEVIARHLHPDGVALLQLGSAAQVELLAAEVAGTLQVVEVREEPGRGAVALISRVV